MPDQTMIQKQIETLLQPWYQSIKEPALSQNSVLKRLLSIYQQTDYGKQHYAESIDVLSSYRKNFPIINYENIKPIIDRVMQGETQLLLNEPVLGWAITRGTTRGTNKFIPMTLTDIKMRISAGRAVLNYAAKKNKWDIFSGVNLNLNFPSRVGSVKAGGKDIEYGYSSGIYTRHVSKLTPVRSVPTQEDIDELGGGKTIKDWEARFELAYQKCNKENVTLVGGVAPTALDFGKYLKKVHGQYPKDIWHIEIMTLGSVPGINTRLRPVLKAFYGNAIIREIYGTTEGMFGQQLDEKKAWVPNYDLFLFEVETIKGIKMLYEMKPGEIGSLVVSTPVLPRYKIGDLILAKETPYFRCIGRDQQWTRLIYYWHEFSTMNLGRL